jgi:hypothetical protein
LLEEGLLREAWMYFRPTGDRAALAPRLEAFARRDEHAQQVIEIALYEGVAPRLGFELVLKHHGVCNAISLYDAHMHGQPLRARQDVAALLVERLYDDLARNLRAEIERREGRPPEASSVAGLIEGRAWLFDDLNYHIDMSHLGAVVRFALVLDDPLHLRPALELTLYARRLAPQYQYPGQEPFVDTYPSHALFFQALLGENVEEALEHFRGRAQALAGGESGQLPVEVYVGLLSRLGRHREAFDAAVDLNMGARPQSAFASSLLELAGRAGAYDRLLDVFRRNGDLLGYGAALVQADGTTNQQGDPP